MAGNLLSMLAGKPGSSSDHHSTPGGTTTNESFDEGNNSVTTFASTNELRRQIIELQRQLQRAEEYSQAGGVEESERCIAGDDDDGDGDNDLGGVVSEISIVLPPPGKSGYLFKWQDRSIGWGGTKWALRYVTLDRGRISYYYSHLETSPRYVLSLRGCAIQDEGWKRNRRHKSMRMKLPLSPMKKKDDGTDDDGPSLDEPGAYFFVFSICHRPDSAQFITSANSPGGKASTLDYVPLLRFSTPSLAEKTQWIKLLSEACAYCETDAFLTEEAERNAEEEQRRRQQAELAEAMPQAERGTLPRIYFAQSAHHSSHDGNHRRKGLVRRPSLSKLPNASLYRSQSKSRDADKAEAASVKGYPPSKPMHRGTAPSFLSNEASEQNYRGFFNLAMIILIVSNFRLLVVAFKSHGNVLASLLAEIRDNQSAMDYEIENSVKGFVLGFGCLQVCIVMAFVLEYCLSRQNSFLPEAVGNVMHHINAHMSILIPTVITWYWIDIPAAGGCLLLNSTITWLKLLSYVLANEDYRHNSVWYSATKSSSKESSGSDAAGKLDSHQATVALIDNLDTEDWDIAYPRNVTLTNIYYFWLVPTLTYQIAFPKTPRVRWLRVAGILIRMVMVFSLFSFFIIQVVAPTLDNLLNDLEATQGRYTLQILADYWLKLAITNTYLWLLMFYFYFHLYFNLFAELLRFGDRVFYKDWWNSVEVSAYWRLWNLPVHYWLVRHLYFPLVRWKVSKMGATFAVFFFSAVVHEWLVSVPFHMMRPWLFFGMMGQLPLIFISKFLYRKFPGSSIGNIIFWVSFCVVGQPMAIMMYTIDYKYHRLHTGADLPGASGAGDEL